MFNFTNILSILASSGALILSVIVFYKGAKDKTRYLYSLCGAGIAMWIITNFLADFYKNEINIALFFSQLTYIPAVLLPFLFFRFVQVFAQISIKKIFLILITVPTVILLLFTFTEANVKSLAITAAGMPAITLGWIYWFFIPYFLLYLGAGTLLLYKKRSQTQDVILRSQINLIIFGVLLTAAFSIFFDVIFPLMGEQRFISLGPASSFFFLLFSFYAILKHHLFNIRVIATELLVGAVSLVLFTDLLLSKSISASLLKLLILVIFVYLGISLIKSVLKEVKYREEITRAYEVEKAARKELERLDKAKDQFLLATQHHMRTPLTSTRGFISLLLEGSFGKLTPKARKALKTSYDSLVRLMKLVNELLDVSQFQLGKEVVRIEPNIKITPILKEIVEELSFETKERGIYLKLNKPKRDLPLIKADPQRLKVALTNLVDNGIKYTKQGGVTINTEVSDSHILIIVQDTGMGIPKEEFPFLFTRTFERSEAAKKAYGPGRGIGLYLTAQIIKAHQGRIWAESEGRGKGSTFYVELPAG